MALDEHTSQQHLSPEARRDYLRGLADRMLLKIFALDDPEDLAGIERTVRVAASIERLHRACDRAETQAPDPRKLEAERADNTRTAIKARLDLAGMLEWTEERRQKLGKWWDAADTSMPVAAPVAAPVVTQAEPTDVQPHVAETVEVQSVAEPEAEATETGHADHIDNLCEAQTEPEILSPTESAEHAQYYAWCLESARAELGLETVSATEFAEPEQEPPPPHAARGGCGPPPQ